MLRTGLITTVGEKVASVESERSSVSLHHVTPIMAVLTAGVLANLCYCERHNLADDVASRH